MVDYPPDRIAGPRLLLRLPVARRRRCTVPTGRPRPRGHQVSAVVTASRRGGNAAGDRRENQRQRRRANLGITLQHSGDIIGLTSCRRAAPHSVEIGYCLGRRWWGKGLMAEVLDMLLGALEGRPRRVPRLGHLQCRQRSIGATAGTSRVHARGPAGPPRRVPHDGTRTTRQLALRQGPAVAPGVRVCVGGVECASKVRNRRSLRPVCTFNALSARPTTHRGLPTPGAHRPARRRRCPSTRRRVRRGPRPHRPTGSG